MTGSLRPEHLEGEPMATANAVLLRELSGAPHEAVTRDDFLRLLANVEPSATASS